MAPQRKNDSVVNIDAWSEDEDRAVVGPSQDERVDEPGDLNRPRVPRRAAPEQREILRHDFPED